jgi:ATP-dependent helicase HrpA
MEDDLARLAPPDFLSHVPHSHLPHLARYLKAVRLRSERAALSPGSDRQKLEQVQPFQDELDGLLQQEGPSSGQQRHRIEEFHWMLEEYRVSVFAQELGTAYPVSAKRLNAKLDEIRHPL